MGIPNLGSDTLVRGWYLRYANRITSKIRIRSPKPDGSPQFLSIYTIRKTRSQLLLV